jgi:glycosyltransferase involved in cell wall biosynthesis
MTSLPVSIIINNYNYGRFLNAAIDSALNVTYRNTEVIVVDDGSVDNSVEVIKSYGSRIISVLKENGGQASAFNSGFAIARGKIVIFLDSDDMLLPNTVQRVVQTFLAHPRISKVQYNLEVIDALANRSGKVVPFKPLSTGDLRARVLKYYDYGWPPTSGNAYSASILERIFPIPEEEYRICADMYLADLTPFFGPIISLNEIGALYRKHGDNYHSGSDIDFDRLRGLILRITEGSKRQKRLANQLSFVNRSPNTWSLDQLNARIVSCKLQPEKHPLPHDTLLHLAFYGVLTSLIAPRTNLKQRILHTLWFISVALSSKALAYKLSEILYFEKKRYQLPRLSNLIEKFIK